MDYLLFLVALLCVPAAVALGAWRQMCIVYANHMSYNCPPAWRNPAVKFFTWILTGILTLAFSLIFAYLLAKNIDDQLGRQAFGGFILLRWFASKYFGAFPAQRKSDQQFIKSNESLKEEFTELVNAIRKADATAVNALLFVSADCINLYDESGLNLLHILTSKCKNVSSDDVEICKLLIKYGAKVDASTKNDLHRTPMHYVAAQGENANEFHAAMAKCLLDKGANVDAKSTLGWTPLHFIAINGAVESLQVFEIMKEFKTNPFAVADDGQTTWRDLWQHGEEVYSAIEKYEKSYLMQ